MTTVRAILFSTLVLFLSAAPTAAVAEPTRFDVLLLELPAGFSVKSTKQPFQISGPFDLSVNISLIQFKTKNKTTDELTEVPQERIVSANERIFSEMTKNGETVLVPKEQQTLSDGTILQMMGIEEVRLFRKGFFVQYLLTSKTSRVAFVTVRGIADLQSRHAEMLKMLEFARWAE